MGAIEAFLLGLLQGLTEFLPVSSSGHLEIGKALLGVEEGGLAFSVVVHGATALSTIVVFRKDIAALLTGLVSAGSEGAAARKFAGLVLVSMVPVAVVGLGFKDAIEARLDGHLKAVGAALLVTAGLLAWAQRQGRSGGSVGWMQAVWIGWAQAVAVLPGISRSGATISAALLLGVDREEAARFSFLMVLPPILGATALEMKDWLDGAGSASDATSGSVLLIGALAAFASGWWACRFMISLVKRNGLTGFAVYCALMGLVALILL